MSKVISRIEAILMKGLHLILCPLLVCFPLYVCDSSCRTDTRIYFTHPEQKIIAELQKRQVVMLGDFNHASPLPLITLTNTLNDWLDEVSTNANVPRQITLVLEADDSLVHLINNYVAVPDSEMDPNLLHGVQYARDKALTPLLNFLLPQGTLEYLEFLNNLHGAFVRIDSIDSKLSGGTRVALHIIGGEALSFEEYKEQLRWSRQQIDAYFVGMRDTLDAVKIESYSKLNPLCKLLIFYGADHLKSGYAQKIKRPESLNSTSNSGYFLAHYLKEYYGDENVLTINQAVIPHGFLRGTPFEEAGDNDIFVSNRDLSRPLGGPDYQYYDATIFRREVNVPDHLADLIFSRRVVEKCIDLIDTMQAYLPGYNASNLVNAEEDALQMVTGESFARAEEWTTWYSMHKFKGFERIESDAFSAEILEDYYSKDFNYETAWHLYYLASGAPLFYPSPQSRIDSNVWKTNWQQIKFGIECGNAIGVYWIGYPDEQKEAHEWLVKNTGVNFSTPDQYLKWWRQRVFNANY